LTLEPGSQVELSGAPYKKLVDIDTEARENREAITGIIEEEAADLRWISCGLTPFAKIDAIPFVPKGRYEVMQRYLPNQGSHSLWMMKGTCATQASFDFDSEEDLNRKFQAITNLAPLTVAMLANSPLAAGKPTGWQSTRAWVWTKTDSARTGFPPAVREGYTHARWIEYLLDSPMMFYIRNGSWAPANGRTFRSWMQEGIEGQFPTMADWELHQTSVFPEARVKSTVEIRSADAVSLELGVAFCALWKGLLYDPGALEEAGRIGRRLAEWESAEIRHLAAAKDGLQARLGELMAWELAEELVRVARRGLEQQGEKLELLEPLEEQVQSRESPAVRLLRASGAEAVIRAAGW
jgi:glutamate--cysteine ligase